MNSVPLSLYVHIPWCVKKCPYCDFNSHAHSTNDLPISRYLSALENDFLTDLAFVEDRPIQSIFFGGGTPSLFPGHAIEHFLNFIQAHVTFANDIEITLEANPGTVEYDNFSKYRNAGVNRLSMGVQSFNDLHLQRLGRIHSAENAKRAFALARKAGFDNINLDLIHGLAGQSVSEAIDDINIAAELAPTHLSWYQLTIEPNTAFYSAPPKLPEEDTLFEIFEQGQNRLSELGYQQYEISAYAHPGKPSKHNLNYWTFGDYLAVGAGAHGKITDSSTGRSYRFSKTRHPEHYMAHYETQSPPEKRQQISALTKRPLAPLKEIEKAELPLEFMMNALRLTHGVDSTLFHERTGLTLNTIDSQLKRLTAQGLLDVTERRICTTKQGKLYLNSVLDGFLED